MVTWWFPAVAVTIQAGGSPVATSARAGGRPMAPPFGSSWSPAAGEVGFLGMAGWDLG